MDKLRIVEFENGTFGVEKRFLYFFSGGFMDKAGFPSPSNPYFWSRESHVVMHATFKTKESAKLAKDRYTGLPSFAIKRVVDDN